jgi:hypothetical protein
MKRITISIFFLLMSIQLLNAQGIRAYYYDSGKPEKVHIPRTMRQEILKNVSNLIYNIDQELRVYFDASRIDELKKNETCLELIFGKDVIIQSKTFGEFRIKRILIPYSGDLAGSEKANAVSILTGKDEYDPTPYLCKDGYTITLNIKNMILKKH